MLLIVTEKLYSLSLSFFFSIRHLSSTQFCSSQIILGEVMLFREIGTRIRIVMRPHIRSRHFPGRGEALDLDYPIRAGNGG